MLLICKSMLLRHMVSDSHQSVLNGRYDRFYLRFSQHLNAVWVISYV